MLEDMEEEEVCTQTGLTSVVTYLMSHDGVNQKTLIANTDASTITIYRIQNILLKHGLIRMEKSQMFNQNLYYLTDKGRKLGVLIVEIRRLLS